MPLTAGARLGPYEIVSALGAGGMGEVYRARDTRLDRPVAVKILSGALAADPQFRERFDREARAISQLTHPSICTLHDVGEHEGTSFLVLELLEGETLADRLDRAGGGAAESPSRTASTGVGLPIDHALAIAIQIADALAAAHRAGIVHRDLKPANIFLVRSGGSSSPPTAKLLDFGLAKTSAPVVGVGGATMMPTTPVNVTAQGTILGTFQYMAPEQIEGLEADARTDLFAFGCVLYEMLAGRKAFEGKTRASLLGAILKDEPAPVSRVQPGAPAALDRIVTTCLAKDPDDRWQTARDLLRELKWVVEGSLSAGAGATAARGPEAGGSDRPAPRMSGARRLIPIAVTAIASAAVVGGAVWALTRQAPVARPVVRLQATPPANAPLAIDAFAPDVAMSPLGTHIAYLGGTGQPRLFVRALDQSDPTPLSAVVGARGPFFSPDGEWIAYFQGADLKKTSIRGGPPVTICTSCASGNRGGTWGADDTIIFAAAGGSAGLLRVRSGGGDPIALAVPDSQQGEQGYAWPELLPDGRAVLFTILVGGGIGGGHVAVRDLTNGAQRILVRGGSHPHFVQSGHVVFAVAGTLRAIGFDPARLTAIGNPLPVLEHVVTKESGASNVSVARDGSLAYISGDFQGTLTLAWIDRQGHEEPIAVPRRNYVALRLSPDGQRVALDVRDQDNDIWIWDFTRQTLTRLTIDRGLDNSPVWTPDGRRIVFASSRTGLTKLFWQPADGTGVVEPLTTAAGVLFPSTFTPDGKSLVVAVRDKTGLDLDVISTEGAHASKPLIRTPFSEQSAELSPDGQWLAYQSNESGQDQIYVHPFPAVDQGRWQISTSGGTRPLWARNGRELFYVDLGGRLMAVPVQSGPGFAAGNPGVVAELDASASPNFRAYDVSRDGRRFLVLKRAPTNAQSNPTQLHVVLNWGEELRRLAPVKP